MSDMRSKGERESGNDLLPNFDKKMEQPQKAIFARDWGSFKRFFENDKRAIMETLDLSGNTAVHVAATRWNKPELIRELLDILPEKADRWRALRKGNAHNNTVLHQVIIHCENVMMVDAVLNYGKDLQVPEDEEGEDKNLPLFELVNDEGETPVYRAAKYGKLQMLKRMASMEGIIMRNHFYRRQGGEDATTDKTSILHVAIIGRYFEVAQWLISEVEGIDKVASANDGNEWSCLHLLSGMPSVFKSYDSHMGLVEKLIYAYERKRRREKWMGGKFIYACLPAKRCDESSNGENYDDDRHLAQRQYMKSVAANALRIILLIGFAAAYIFALSFPIAAIILASAIPVAMNIGEDLVRIKKISYKKKQHKLAEELADFLVKRDNSWMYSKHAKPRKEVVLPVNQRSNIGAAGEKAKQTNEEGQSENPISSKVYTPLLQAASTGIVEIVKKIIDLHPEAIFHVSHAENILHVAVKHRQKKIYMLLKKYDGALKSLAAQISNKGCTLLHHAAIMDHYDGGNRAGVVFQLEEELHWFERVKKITPSAFVLYRNDDNVTARALFESEHSQMLNEAQKWIKATAQSCSTVAVLIATVVFPAAYTVPGGYNEQTDEPEFGNSTVFRFFIIMDAVAVTSSILSVVMFLSILTSPFHMQEFKKRLPLKLSSGFAWLFISLTATMLTFVSSILLNVVNYSLKEIAILIYCITVFPFFIGLTQYSVFMIVKYKTKMLWLVFKEIAPERLIKLTKRIRERICSKYL